MPEYDAEHRRLDRAVRDGGDQHQERPPHQRAARPPLRHRLQVRRDDGRAGPGRDRQGRGRGDGEVQPDRRRQGAGAGRGADRRRSAKAAITRSRSSARCPSGDKLRATVTGDRDPGYGSTSKMIAEAAICLVEGRRRRRRGVDAGRADGRAAGRAAEGECRADVRGVLSPPCSRAGGSPECQKATIGGPRAPAPAGARLKTIRASA